MAANKPKFNQKIVTLGGGTGHFAMLRGLVDQNAPENITAITGTWDSGGSSGRLRVEMGVLPSGDIRQCLLALMEDEEQRQVAQRLFNDRQQDETGPLKGHAIGNLLESRLQKLYQGQDRGIDATRALFRVKAHLTPVSLTPLQLSATTSKGNEINGEDLIDTRGEKKNFNPQDKISRIYFDTTADPNPKALEAISNADKIIISPGDLYTSILPHLLVKGVAETIIQSKAKLVFVLNLMTKRGETDSYNASDFLRSFLFYLGSVGRLNYLIVNNVEFDKEILKLYEEEGQKPIEIDEAECKKLSEGLQIAKAALAKYSPKEHLLRHDSELLAQTILELN